MHSPEPWREEGDHIVDKNGCDIIGFGESDSDDTDRIIACVNALKDVDDPEVFMAAVKDVIQKNLGSVLLRTKDGLEIAHRLAEHIDMEIPT